MMAVNVGPNVTRRNYVFSLSDGETTIGLLTCNQRGEISPVAGFRQSPMPRTALKTSQGAARYEDFELPFVNIIQENWSGGINLENFETDRSRYRDGLTCDTGRGDVICGPKSTKTTSLTTATQEGSMAWDNMRLKDGGAIDHIFATKHVPASSYTLYNILCRVSQWPGRLKVRIYSDDDGPDTLLRSTQITMNGGNNFRIVKLPTSLDLVSGTTYWIAITEWPSISPDPDDTYDIFFERDETGGEVQYYNGSTWADAWTIGSDVHSGTDKDIPFKTNYVNPITGKGDFRFFEYRRSLYALANFDDGSAPKLYRNGYRGAGKSNSADKSKLNTDQDLSGVDLAGCIALIMDGTGSEEEQPWRVIVSNTTTGTNDVITVEEPWSMAHSAATSWVALGSDDWKEITGHGLTGRVTDIIQCKKYVLFAQGDSINLRRMREYNNSGTWTTAYEADGTNKADLLLVNKDTDGTVKVWKALIDDNKIESAEAQSWGTAHTFADAIYPTTEDSPITGLIAYGEPRIPYVFKEDGFGSIKNNIYGEVPVGEMAAVRSEYNGRALMTHDVYLYFSMGEKIERYYDRRLDDVGPDRDEGLPESRRGVVRRLLPYPGRYYALVYTDGNVPSILMNNGMGWHEMWRGYISVAKTGTASGQAVPFYYNQTSVSSLKTNDIAVQVIPGETTDRMWVDYGGEIYRLPITFNPRKDRSYEYADLSQLETAWMYGDLRDVEKYWHSIKLHTEDLSGADSTNQIIRVEYKVDEDTSWTLAGYADTSPIDEVNLSNSYDVTGHRIKFRFTLHTDDSQITPRILAIVVKAIVRVDVKKGWSVTCLANPELNLRGQKDEQGSILSVLDAFAASDSTPAPLVLRHNLSYYDNKRVFIDPASIQLTEVKLEKIKNTSQVDSRSIVTFTMYEV